MLIRPATLDDIPQILALGRLMHEESVYAPYPLDEQKVRLLIKHLLIDPLGIALVAEDAGVVVGGFLGVVTEHWFGLTRQALDFALFMHPSYRGGRAAYRLLKAYVDEAKKRGADQVVMANSTGYEVEKVASLFEVAGFQKNGYVLAMHVPTGDTPCV